VAPTVIRMAAPADTDTEFHFGLRTGPRIPSVVEANAAGTFNPSVGGLVPPELGAVYEFDYTRVVWRQLALHAGAQAEFFGGIPLPSLGLGVAVSYRWQLGPVSVAPALGGRGATSFGLHLIGGTGHFLSGDFSLTLSVAGIDRSRIGLVPFVSLQQTFGANVTSGLVGGLVAVRYDAVEIFAGVARAYLFPAGPGWNVPMVGVRVGGS
jgi:hypothetical protein